MTAPVSFDLSPTLVERLRQAQLRRGQDEVAQLQDAVLLESFISSTYLTLDGRVLSLDHIADDAKLIAVTEPGEAYAAIVVGAKNLGIEELLDLLPAAPTGATSCPRCDGSRWIAIGPRAGTDEPASIVCADCRGLGWREKA